MEHEQRKREMEIERAHAAKEKIFAEKVAERVTKLEEEERKVEHVLKLLHYDFQLMEQERMYKDLLREKQNELERLQDEAHKYRIANGIGDSGHSTGNSPDGVSNSFLCICLVSLLAGYFTV